MSEALRCLNIPTKVLNNFQALYESPKFRVVTRDSKSEFQRQETGIRHGCPLSPYLFILLMTVMFEDIHQKTNPKLFNASINKGAIDGLNCTDIVYADDTILLTKDSQSASFLLQHIEE